MTDKEKLTQQVEMVEKTKTKKTKSLRSIIAWFLIWAMCLRSLDSVAQEVPVQYAKHDQKELVIQNPHELEYAATIKDPSIWWTGLEPELDDWDDTLEPTEEEWDTVDEPSDTIPDSDGTPKTPEVEKDSKVKFGWMVQIWTWVAWDVAEVCSDKPSMTLVLNTLHKKTWLWFTYIRLDDFSSDEAHPCSKATILDPYLTKTFWPDWKIRVTAEWKYTIIDKKPELSGFAPDLKLAYTDKWWTLEAMYIHRFQGLASSDAFRLSISKKINEIFEVTAQWWYDTWYDKHFYGRVTLDIDLWSGFMVELSCIAKHWKLSPTWCLVYRLLK